MKTKSNRTLQKSFKKSSQFAKSFKKTSHKSLKKSFKKNLKKTLQSKNLFTKSLPSFNPSFKPSLKLNRTTRKTRTSTPYEQKSISSISSSLQSSAKNNTSKARPLNMSNYNYLNEHLENKNNYSNLLQMVCKNSGTCMALGPYDEYIKTLFDNFNDLTLIDNSKMRLIGTQSVNGFIVEMPFNKDNFTALTCLKCAKNATSDNLAYEYYVGKYFINTYLKKLPCFLETYGLYAFNNEISYLTLKDAINYNAFNDLYMNNIITKVDDNILNDISEFVKFSCKNNYKICIQIQHFDHFYSLGLMLNTEFDRIKYDLYNLLYQLYFCLCVLGPKYTHYDSHLNNVFLYKPFDGNKYILMRYHCTNGINQIFEFKTEHIIKLIDYGSNYFDNGSITSKELIEEVCRNKIDCEGHCGKSVGYSTIQGSADPNFDFYWIDPTKPNMSHDIKSLAQINRLYNLLKNSFNSTTIKYLDKTMYGTPEDNTGDIKNLTNIYNVKMWLEQFITSFNSHKQHKKYAGWTHVATMDVFDDGRDYLFTMEPETNTSSI